MCLLECILCVYMCLFAIFKVFTGKLLAIGLAWVAVMYSIASWSGDRGSWPDMGEQIHLLLYVM